MGASESPSAVRPETHPPPPGPSDSRATEAALGVGLHLERMRMLTLPRMLLTECGSACCLPPHPLHSGAGSQPGACPAHEEPCPCHLSLGTSCTVQHISCLPAHPCSRECRRSPGTRTGSPPASCSPLRKEAGANHASIPTGTPAIPIPRAALLKDWG